LVSVAKFGDFGLTLDPESLIRKVGVFRRKLELFALQLDSLNLLRTPFCSGAFCPAGQK